MLVKKNILLSVFSLCLFTTNSIAGNFDGMKLLGKGEAYYLKIFKVYDASLYSEELEGDETILHPDVSKCLRLEYSVGVDRDDFITAANTILSRQFSSEQLRLVNADIKALHAGYEDVERGDIYSLCYNETSKITRLSLNGGEMASVSSPVFAEMYFSIWLGNSNPLDEKLRSNLLAQLGK